MLTIASIPILATNGAAMTATMFRAVLCWGELTSLVRETSIAKSKTMQSPRARYQKGVNALPHSAVGKIGITTYTYSATSSQIPNAEPRSQPMGNACSRFVSAIASAPHSAGPQKIPFHFFDAVKV